MITVSNLIEFLKIIAPAWVTLTAYTQGQYVTSSSVVYVCLVAHTSGTFATDLSAGKWRAMTVLSTAINSGIAFVSDACNRDYSVTVETSKTEYTAGNSKTFFRAREFPVTTVTTIKYFDEDTSTWTSIFETGDSVSNSVLINGTDDKIELYNGYMFESGKRYEIVYKFTNVISIELKQVAIEQAARYFLNSNEGQSWFAKNSENVGSQANESLGLESQEDMNERHFKILERYRIANV